MNAKLPEISVIMSCFNAADFIVESIESILNQSFSDIEFILIDDGSTDNSLDIIKRYAAKDNRIIVIEKKNSGLTDSLNVGIRASRGAWIARLDADDIALQTRLEEQIAFLKKTPDILLLGSGFVEIDPHGKVIKLQGYPRRHHKLLTNLRKFKRFFPHSSAMFRSDIVRKIGGYNPRIICAQDWDLWLRLSEQGEIACLNKPLVKIRKHSNQVSHDRGGRAQFLYGLAGTVCHFLRIHGCSDPSTSNDETTWQEYIKWVDRQIMEEGAFENRKAYTDARDEYFATKNMPTGVFRFGIRLLQSKHASAMVWGTLFGSSLPERMARDWRKRSCAAS